MCCHSPYEFTRTSVLGPEDSISLEAWAISVSYDLSAISNILARTSKKRLDVIHKLSWGVISRGEMVNCTFIHLEQRKERFVFPQFLVMMLTCTTCLFFSLSLITVYSWVIESSIGLKLKTDKVLQNSWTPFVILAPFHFRTSISE